ncbi:hypothetical protein WEI85_02880 [Actinomycetes bacterium KLBMP 9797]
MSGKDGLAPHHRVGPDTRVEGSYIVVVADDADPRAVAERAGVTPRHVLPRMPAFTADLTDAQLDAVRRDPHVSEVVDNARGGAPEGTDWADWHAQYDDPQSTLPRRLIAVQSQIRAFLDERPPGPLRMVSMCAGQGRDILGVLADHPRRHDVTGRLVELNPDLAADATTSARAAGLAGIEVRVGDAAQSDSYAGAAPADLVLACGIFGNITNAAIKRTVGFLPQLCAAGATVIWTRHRDEPDLVPTVCDWFTASGFALRWLSDKSEPYGVGVHTLTVEPTPLTPGERIFRFIR